VKNFFLNTEENKKQKKQTTTCIIEITEMLQEH